MNPFDVLPPKARLYVYSIAAVALLGLTAWQAAEGNWGAAAITFLTSISSTQSATKVDIPDDEVDVDVEEDVDADSEDEEDTPED